MILSIRKRTRFTVAFLLFVFMQTYSVEVYALTSGPAQEEYASFEPVGTTDLVNLYTGDFTYNIPLLSVPGPNGGYPINLAYHSGIGMDQEASWVGLGWNVNVGAVNRNLRGLPDDFNGDKVKYKRHMRDNSTFGLDLFQTEEEIVGAPQGSKSSSSFGSSTTLQVYYNNYKGLGYRVKHSPKYTSSAVQAGINFSYDPHEGIGIGASFSVQSNFKEGLNASIGVAGQYNSRQGLQGISLTGAISKPYYRDIVSPKTGKVERKKFSYPISAGASTFSFSQGVPTTTMEMYNTIKTTDLRLGFTPGTDDKSSFKNPPGSFNSLFPFNYVFSKSSSTVMGNGIDRFVKSYGYFYHREGVGEDLALKDFNYSPFSYSPHIPHVPPSNVTNDIFAATGQGISSVFKVYHSEVGIHAPTTAVSITKQYRASIDAGVVPETRNQSSCPILSYQVGIGGAPPEIGTAIAYTGVWNDHKHTVDQLQTLQKKSGKSAIRFNSTFFKDMGDRPAIVETDDIYDTWKGDAPIRIDIDKVEGGGVKMNGFSGSINTGAKNFAAKKDRVRRTRVIESLTHQQADDYGTMDDYTYYDLNTDSDVKKSTDYENNPERADHLSEISILEPDGMRYTYGLPAYNMVQEDAHFSVPKQNTEIPSSIVDVPPGGYDNANGVWSRKPEFMDKKELPPYAHSWMLSSVVSADYVDVTGNGISEDDLGYWVDFKYQKTSDAYHWRAPYQGAIYMPGTTQNFDDKGSYSKGTKELFYLKEIRTKTHIAVFELKERKDALGASTGLQGGVSSNPKDKMQALDKIKLYTIDEYQKGKIDPAYEPVPLKVTHFGYETNPSKELCKGVPNRIGIGGKLTLKKLWFTYQNSTRGSSSPYVFHYGNNPSYSLKNNDCWGNYKNNNLINYPYHQFPYTDQSTRNFVGQLITYDVPWHLERIDLPTGSSMHIVYEQDDYAYVEDKKAMQLYEIVHLGKNFAGAHKKRRSEPKYSSAMKGSLQNIRQDNATGDPISPDFEYKIFFPLKDVIPELGTSTASSFYDGYNNTMEGVAEWFKDHYIGETKKLYFKAAVKLLDGQLDRDRDEVDFVSGYGDLRVETPNVHYGVARSNGGTTGGYDIGYVTLYAVPFQAFGVAKDHLHPIRDAAFQHLRFNRSDLIHGAKKGSSATSLFSALPDLMSMMAGYKYFYKIMNHAPEIFLDGFSQIRLQVPDGKKRGGGVRVKEIRITDNWKQMTGGSSSDYQDATYGQIYDYTIEENGEKISSGVAYEPFAGKEQSPMVVPSTYEHAAVFQQPNNLFMENPIMMAHYPSASVGYRKVKVKSITAKDPQNKRMTTPITEYEFYSPKEFPIQFERTTMDKVGPDYKIIPIPGIYTEFRKYEGVSQGYSLIFNDMAGKPKSITQKTYPNDSKGYEGTVISRQEYEYFTDDDGKISSEVDVFTEDGKYEKARLGVEVDIQVELNENKQSADNFTLDFNFMSGIMPIINGVSCIPFFGVSSGGISGTSSSLKTAVVQKFVQKKGILKSTTITTQSSTITTENLVFDALTSEPLLTKTTNEFNDPIYSYTQKAHWHYDGMAAAFKNVGTIIDHPVLRATAGNQQGMYEINYNEFPFVEGDEVFIEFNDVFGNWKGETAKVYRIFKSSPTATAGFIGLARTDGSIVDVALIKKITIVRSGRKNLLYAPAGAIAAKNVAYQAGTTLGNSQTLTFDKTTNVLNASAVKYRDFWPNARNCGEIGVCSATYCVDGNKYTGVGGVANGEQVFLNKVNSGEIELKLDGRTVSANEITIEGVCKDTLGICVRTQNQYEVKILTGTNPIPQVYGNYVKSGTCIYEGDDITLPCDLNRSTKVDGIEWPSSQITIGSNSCEFIKGYFEATENGVTRRPNQEYDCMTHTADLGSPFLQTKYYIYPFPHETPPVPPIVKYSFLYLNLLTDPLFTSFGPIREFVPWRGSFGNGTYDGVKNFGELTQRLKTHTGKNWVLSTEGELCAYMSRAEADELKNRVRLGLQHYGTYPALWFAQTTTNLGGCHPFGNNRDDIWYDFEYDVINQPEITLNNIPAGNHIINNKWVKVPKSKDIYGDRLMVSLPTNEVGIVHIYDLYTGKIVYGVFFNTRGSSIKIRLPLKGIGEHKLEIFEKGNPNPLEKVTLECTPASVIASEVPVCDNNGISYVPSTNVNYYQNGTKGNWRPWTSYTYVADRDDTKASIRDQGVLETFTPFSWTGANGRAWQRSGLASKYSADGYELESIDAIGNYSAALYGYNDNLPIAVAQNARYNEILFEGFENYPKDCNAHWAGGGPNYVVDTEAHTGKYSYKVNTGNREAPLLEEISLAGVNEEACADALSRNFYRPGVHYNREHILQFLQEGIETEEMTIPKVMRTTTKGATDHVFETLPQACNCLGKFAPKAGEKYTFSAWVKRAYPVYDMITYKLLHLAVRFRDATGNTIGNTVEKIEPSGSMVEHWQRLSGDIVIPSNAVSMQISLFNLVSDAYIDDLRIQPFGASMQTYVYDKMTLRNTAVLDDNNYATFYIYDERGQLEKTKKETTEGIKTINEGRQYISGN